LQPPPKKLVQPHAVVLSEYFSFSKIVLSWDNLTVRALLKFPQASPCFSLCAGKVLVATAGTPPKTF